MPCERANGQASHYQRKLQTKAGMMTLKVPKLRRVPFETAIIERLILGVAEGAKEDYEGWRTLLKHLKARGLHAPRLIISDACMGLVEAKHYPSARWQRCVVRLYRNVFTKVPRKNG